MSNTVLKTEKMEFDFSVKCLNLALEFAFLRAP